MATARVTELKALSVKDGIAGGGTDWVVPVSGMTDDPVRVDILDDQKMVGYYDTLPARGGSRKYEGSFDSNLFGAKAGLVSSSTLKTVASISKNVPLSGLFAGAGFSINVVGAGTSFVYMLPDNVATSIKKPHMAYWMGDQKQVMTNTALNLELSLKAGEKVNCNWQFMGQFTTPPVYDATYPTYSLATGAVAAIANDFTLSFAQASFGTAITTDIESIDYKFNNKLVMVKDLTQDWGYSEPEVVAPRNSTIEITLRAPYSIGKSGTDFWKMFQWGDNPQSEAVLCKCTAKVTGYGYWNTHEFTCYFKMNDVHKVKDNDGVVYYTVTGQIIPFSAYGASPFTYSVIR